MNLEGIMLSETSQTEKKIPYNLTYMWNLKNKQTNKQNKTDSQVQKTKGWLPEVGRVSEICEGD